MGIFPQYHRKGIGKKLIEEVEIHLKNEGVKMLQVKTISEERDCKFYAKTRQFYKAVGFIPLEVFPKLWDEANPCLQLVKQIYST
jgi:GNAT superfamily N-acetyltransferase